MRQERGIFRIVRPLERRAVFNAGDHRIQTGAHFRRVRSAQHNQHLTGGRRRPVSRPGIEGATIDHFHHRLFCRFISGNIGHIIRICRDESEATDMWR